MIDATRTAVDSKKLAPHLPRCRGFWVEHGEGSRHGCREGVNFDCHFYEEITARTIQVYQARQEGGRPGFFSVMKLI
jgi:Zn-finger nucleic acid-binding protein